MAIGVGGILPLSQWMAHLIPHENEASSIRRRTLQITPARISIDLNIYQTRKCPFSNLCQRRYKSIYITSLIHIYKASNCTPEKSTPTFFASAHSCLKILSRFLLLTVIATISPHPNPGIVQHLNSFGFDRAPGTSPSVVASTGISLPFSSFACSRLNPHNKRAKFRKIDRSATCMPGQILLPPPKEKWSRALTSGNAAYSPAVKLWW